MAVEVPVTESIPAVEVTAEAATSPELVTADVAEAPVVISETPAKAPVEAPAEASAEAPAEPPSETPANIPAETTTNMTETKPEEKAKERGEIKPVEEGHLDYKGQGTNFPKNLIFSKKLFWFGSEPVDLKAISSFKAYKIPEAAHHVTAWASETGNGLLFYSEKSDKSTPHGAIQLAEASEPSIEGAYKFHFTVKGHKHNFKATSSSERDSWVAQLRVKIAEARELATTVTESEKYKSTLEVLKPAAAKKDEKAEKAVEDVVTEAVTPGATTADAPATETVSEALKEESKDEEAKRPSASRKRVSIFGSFLGKKAEFSPETKEAESDSPVAEPSAEAPASDVVSTEPTRAAEAPVTAEVSKPEEKPEEAKETPTRRQSLFSNLSFGKKRLVAEPASPPAEPSASTHVADNAPVIPAPGSVEPLSTEVASPTTVPTETGETTPTHEHKKEAKSSDKRKSSLPFVFGKKEKSSMSDDEGEKSRAASQSPFSKLRATIKGKGKAEKVEEKKDESSVVLEASEASKGAEKVKPEPAASVEETPKVESTPTVTAAA